MPCLEFRAYHSWNDHDGNGVRTTRVWRRVLGVEHAVIESVDLEQGERGGEVLVARVRVKAGAARRCSRCQRRCPGYDTSASPRRWRSLDLGSTQVFLQATTSRVSCPEHGVVVAAVPWARPGSRFTTAFEDTAAWLVSPRRAVSRGDLAAGGVAQRVRHHHPRRRGPGRAARPAGGAAPDRDRRDLLPLCG